MSTSSCQEDSKIVAQRKARETWLQEWYFKEIKTSLLHLVNRADGGLYFDRSLKVNRVKCMLAALKQVAEQMEKSNEF